VSARRRPRKGRVLSSKTLFQGRVFGVRRDHLIEPSGLEVTLDVVTHSGSIVLLPVLPDGRIVLVRQYRHATGQHLWELVAGRIEPGESPVAAARRELLEETGYRARRFCKLLDFFSTPGFLTERMLVYSAHGLTPGPAQPEADEAITTRAFRPAELDRMIRRRRFHDAKSIAGILYYLRYHQPR
jgi:ADP-ribose pyrophosphatase